MKTILVTGATSGIGKAISLYLSKCNYRVVLCGRNQNKLDSMIKEMGNNAESICCDFRNIDSALFVFEESKKRELVYDGLVYSAGVSCIHAARNCDTVMMEDTFHVNVESFISLCSCFVKKRNSVDSASIVAISSLAATNQTKGQSIYVATKAALEGYVKALSIDVADRGIRVNAIAPAFVNTPMMNGQDALVKYDEDKIINNQPLGVIEPKYIAYLAEYLLSDKSSYITGSVIPVSGGAF